MPFEYNTFAYRYAMIIIIDYTWYTIIIHIMLPEDADTVVCDTIFVFI